MILAGLFGLVRNRADRSPAPSCDPILDARCSAGSSGGAPSADGGVPVPTPTGLSTLPSETACRNTGYLCADLETWERIRVQRWRSFTGTLVVHLPTPEIADRGAALKLQRAASAGIRLWNGQPFPILVDERGSRPAHIQVSWVRILSGWQIGLATTQWSPRTGLEVLSLELVTQSPSGGPMDSEQIRLVAAHEMGHALGLPHSNQPRDVMFPTNTATSLSARDYRTLEALYDLEDGTEIVRSPPR